eukprot:gene27533-36225_t
MRAPAQTDCQFGRRSVGRGEAAIPILTTRNSATICRRPAMSLDTSTLYLVATLVAAMLGVMLLFFGRQEKIAALNWWGYAYLLGATSVGLWTLASAFLGEFVSLLLNAVGLVACGMVWTAARVFHGRRPIWGGLFLGGVAWVATIVSLPMASDALRMTVGAGIVAFYAALTAHELWSERRKPMQKRWPAIIVPLLHGAVLMLPILLGDFLTAGHGDLSSSVWVTAFAIELVLYAVGTVFLIFMLVSERTVSAHKAAASCDPLTGMFNRRGFSEATSRMIEREAKAGRPVTVMIFDIDHFKSINDRFGHPAGDEILKLFAAVITNTLRITDLSGRIGGEEFGARLRQVGAARHGSCRAHMRAAARCTLAADARLACMRIARQQRRRLHHHAVEAVAALRGLRFFERGLHRMPVAARAQPFERGDGAASNAVRGNHARARRHAVHMHRAGAALPQSAAVLGPVQAQVVAQHVQQRRSARHAFDRSRLAVDQQVHEGRAVVVLRAVFDGEVAEARAADALEPGDETVARERLARAAQALDHHARDDVALQRGVAVDLLAELGAVVLVVGHDGHALRLRRRHDAGRDQPFDAAVQALEPVDLAPGRFQRLNGDIVQNFRDDGPSIAVPFASAQWGSLASFGATRFPGTKRYYGTSGNSFVAAVEFGPIGAALAAEFGLPHVLTVF